MFDRFSALFSFLVLYASAYAVSAAPPSTLVIQANDTLKTCYRNPVLLETPSGSLLCFVEERYRGATWKPNEHGDHSCPDNYGVPGHSPAGGHNLGFARSDDGGKTWQPLVRLAGNCTNLAAEDGIDYTNNAALVVSMPNGDKRILWQYGTQNNPSLQQYGRILQRHSDDNGLTWSWPPLDLTYAGIQVGLPGATPGPARGIQLPTGRVVFCAWGNRANVTFGVHGWNLAANFANTLVYSDDYGLTWNATPPVAGQGWNECFITRTGDEVLEISRRLNPDSSIPKGQAYPKNTYATKRFDFDLNPTSKVGTLDARIETPICEGSLTADSNGALYFSHPQSKKGRTNLTIHMSTDGGQTWPTEMAVWPKGGTGYSSMLALKQELVVAFNQWSTSEPKSSKDGPGQFIRFLKLPRRKLVV